MMFPDGKKCALVALFLLVTGCTRTPDHTLKVLTFRDRQSSALRQVLPQFEKQHGIKVQFDDIPASSVATKMMTDLAAGGTYDVYALDEPFLPQFQSSLLAVTEWPADALTDAAGFEKKALQASEFEGQRLGLPVNGNVYQFIFRKDLFENKKEQSDFELRFKRKLKAPENFLELLQIAQFFHRPPQMYGFAPFTKMSEGTTVELLWLLSGFGYTPGESGISRSTVTDALRFYEQLLATAPRSARAWHHTERMSAYAKGRIAQMMTWNSFFFDLEDEYKSLVVGKTGYAPSPGEKATGIAGSWIAAVRKGSPKAALAAQFIAWWTSPDLTAQLIPRGLSTARADVLTHTGLNKSFPWLATTHHNFAKSFLRPRHSNYRKTSNELSQAFTRWIAGQHTLEQASEAIYTSLLAMNQLVSRSDNKKRAN